MYNEYIQNMCISICENHMYTDTHLKYIFYPPYHLCMYFFSYLYLSIYPFRCTPLSPKTTPSNFIF